MLGITPENDRLGVLQDIHWAAGTFGYFSTYTLGNLMGLQLYEAAQHALPGLEDELRRGAFGGLLGWLRENVHRHGFRHLPEELLYRATGSPLSAEPCATCGASTARSTAGARGGALRGASTGGVNATAKVRYTFACMPRLAPHPAAALR